MSSETFLVALRMWGRARVSRPSQGLSPRRALLAYSPPRACGGLGGLPEARPWPPRGASAGHFLPSFLPKSSGASETARATSWSRLCRGGTESKGEGAPGGSTFIFMTVRVTACLAFGGTRAPAPRVVVSVRSALRQGAPGGIDDGSTSNRTRGGLRPLHADSLAGGGARVGHPRALPRAFLGRPRRRARAATAGRWRRN